MLQPDRDPTTLVRLPARSLDRRAAALLALDGPVGTVQSVFARAFNLQTAVGLLGVAARAAGDGPLTVLVAAPPGGFPSLGVRAGQPARVERGWLRVGPALAIDLAGATVWRPRRPERRRWDRAAVARRLAAARAAALAAAPRAGLGGLVARLDALADDEGSPGYPSTTPVARGTGSPSGLVGRSGCSTPPAGLDPLLERAWRPLVALAHAWRAGDAAGVAAAARGLVGLGPGLTPAGDDLLAGFVYAALHLAGSPGSAGAAGGALAPQPDRPPVSGGPPDETLDARAAAVLAAAAGRTTALGLQRLRHAAAGELEAWAAAALDAVLDGPSAAVRPAVERAARYGHSSGADTLAGLLLAVWLAVHGEPPAARR